MKTCYLVPLKSGKCFVFIRGELHTVVIYSGNVTGDARITNELFDENPLAIIRQWVHHNTGGKTAKDEIAVIPVF